MFELWHLTKSMLWVEERGGEGKAGEGGRLGHQWLTDSQGAHKSEIRSPLQKASRGGPCSLLCCCLVQGDEAPEEQPDPAACSPRAARTPSLSKGCLGERRASNSVHCLPPTSFGGYHQVSGVMLCRVTPNLSPEVCPRTTKKPELRMAGVTFSLLRWS